MLTIDNCGGDGVHNLLLTHETCFYLTLLVTGMVIGFCGCQIDEASSVESLHRYPITIEFFDRKEHVGNAVYRFRDARYKCDKCGDRYSSLKVMGEHLRDKHGVENTFWRK